MYNSASTTKITCTSVLVRFSTRLPIGSADNFHPTMTTIAAMGDDPTCFLYMETTHLTLLTIEVMKSPQKTNCNNKKSLNFIFSTHNHINKPVAVPMAAASTSIHHD